MVLLSLIGLTSILDIRKSDFNISDVIFSPFMVNDVMKNHLIWLKDYVTGVKIRRISRIFTPSNGNKNLVLCVENRIDLAMQLDTFNEFKCFHLRDVLVLRHF